MKEHFDGEAPDFDAIINRLIPYYPRMIEALASVLPFDSAAPLEVLDLGCGTGTVALEVKRKFPKANITCVDFAPAMLEQARVKLGTGQGFRFQVGDFRSLVFDRRYDAVVSSLALHHLEDDASKKAFYGRILSNLNPGGAFYNADVVLASAEGTQACFMEKWKEYLIEHGKLTLDRIENFTFKQYKDEDRPARMIEQLKWLEDLGFIEVDVIWKHYNFAVYGGRKPN